METYNTRRTMTLLDTYPPEIQSAYPQWLMVEAYRAKQSKSIITMDEVLNMTCDLYQVKKADVLSKNRRREFVQPRQIAMHLMRIYCRETHKAIGRFFNGRDHTTVMYAVQTIKGFQEIQDAQTLSDLATLESKIQISVGRAV